MFQSIWEVRAIRYMIYSTSAVLLSEVAYRCLRRLWHCTTDECDAEVSEVIWTNELTQSCSGHHVRNGIVEKQVENGSDKYVKQLPKPRTGTAAPCSNRFCAANNVGRLISLIDQTKYSIDLAMYTFTSYDLSNAIGRAIKRGVQVRIISDKEMVYSTCSQIINLTNAGVPVRCPSGTMLMHHKFCILDGPLRALSILNRKGKTLDKKRVKGVILSGSLNWTMQGFGGNWENIVITSNKKIVNQFEQEYERMWIAFNNTEQHQ